MMRQAKLADLPYCEYLEKQTLSAMDLMSRWVIQWFELEPIVASITIYDLGEVSILNKFCVLPNFDLGILDYGLLELKNKYTSSLYVLPEAVDETVLRSHGFRRDKSGIYIFW